MEERGKVFATCGHEITDLNEVPQVEEIIDSNTTSYPSLCWQCLQARIYCGLVTRILIKDKWFDVRGAGR